jgi:hypothetical protein
MGWTTAPAAAPICSTIVTGCAPRPAAAAAATAAAAPAGPPDGCSSSAAPGGSCCCPGGSSTCGGCCCCCCACAVGARVFCKAFSTLFMASSPSGSSGSGTAEGGAAAAGADTPGAMCTPPCCCWGAAATGCCTSGSAPPPAAGACCCCCMAGAGPGAGLVSQGRGQPRPWPCLMALPTALNRAWSFLTFQEEVSSTRPSRSTLQDMTAGGQQQVRIHANCTMWISPVWRLAWQDVC